MDLTRELHPIACYHQYESWLPNWDVENAIHFFERDARWHRNRIAVLDKSDAWFPQHSLMMLESLQAVEAYGGTLS